MFGNNADGEYELSFRIDGKLITGTFHIESGLVVATYNGDTKTTQLGGSTSQSVARLLIREIVTAQNMRERRTEENRP